LTLKPERIEPDSSNPNYDIRADIWSFGITLVELATGEYPYKQYENDFAVMAAILKNAPPRIEGDNFSDNFKDFVKKWYVVLNRWLASVLQ
jgi:serine/threonine protein kinase